MSNEKLLREQSWLETARINEPEGSICGLCGDDNTFADDIGFFYILVDAIPVCLKCYWRSPEANLHRELYGTGER